MSKIQTPNLTFGKITKFWSPLAATWLMMSVEGPFLAAIIARMSEPKYNLASYGIAFSFALIIEAPVIMIMSAAVALVKSKASYRKMRNFTYSLNLIITLLMVIFLIEPIFNFIAKDLIQLTDKVAGLTYRGVLLLMPWPAAIGYRRFFQGILINSNQTKRVAFGTAARLSSMFITAIILYSYSNLDGVIVGTAALSVGVTTEAVFIRMMAFKTVKKLRSVKPLPNEILSYKEILIFYYPLALTSLLGLGVHPMVTFFLGQSRMALESLAVLPVINALVFIFRSVGLSFQEVVLALVGEKNENYILLRNYSLLAVTIATTMLFIIAFTPLADIWFRNVSGLSIDLSSLSIFPLKILAFLPGLTFLISFQRALLVNARNTKPITTGTAIEVVGIIIVLFVGIKLLSVIGVFAAAAAYVLGRLCANAYLIAPILKIKSFTSDH